MSTTLSSALDGRWTVHFQNTPLSASDIEVRDGSYDWWTGPQTINISAAADGKLDLSIVWQSDIHTWRGTVQKATVAANDINIIIWTTDYPVHPYIKWPVIKLFRALFISSSERSGNAIPAVAWSG